MTPDTILKRLSRILSNPAISPEEIEVITEAAHYIEQTEMRHSIMRPDPLFGRFYSSNSTQGSDAYN